MSKKKLRIYLSLVITIATIFPGSTSTVKASQVTATTTTENAADQTPGVTPTQTPDQQVPTDIPTTAPDQSSITPTPPVPTTDPSTQPTTSPTITPSAVPTIIPTPQPTPTPFRSKTLQRMSAYDYVGMSVTGISNQKDTLSNLQKNVKTFGTLYGTGMPYEEYKSAMSYQWKDVTEYDKKPIKINADLKQTMNYSTYASILKKLSRYPGVYLYQIGTTTEGRAMYAVEVDVNSSYSKNVIMLTGQIHAREFGGGTILVKELVDLVQKAQTDKNTMELLKKNKFVAVPIVNIDGREALINAASKWTTQSGGLWKAYTNGTDGGRNFPGLQWGQVAKGAVYKSIIASKPGYGNYPGAYAGSNNETKAMMKWLYQYTVVEKAALYIDMHQQGSIIYAGKTWQTKADEQKSKDLRTDVMNLLNKGITVRKYTRVYDGSLYGLQGEGSSLTDYAVSLATGAKFSPAYGFSAFADGKKEYILMQVKDLDTSRIKVKEANQKLAAITVEIGYGDKYLGNSAYARRLLANEYNYYNYSKLLESLPKMIK